MIVTKDLFTLWEPAVRPGGGDYLSGSTGGEWLDGGGFNILTGRAVHALASETGAAEHPHTPGSTSQTEARAAEHRANAG
jgi:hypothetical protein